MSDILEEPTGVGDASVDRRGLLKVAAAAGIGVAAWSTPGITSLGGTPVYAAVCTFATTPIEYRSNDNEVTCESSCRDGLTLHDCVNFGPNATFTACSSPNDGCTNAAAQTPAQTQPKIVFTSPGFRCRLKDVFLNRPNGSTDIFPTPVPGSDLVPILDRTPANRCSSRWGVIVECVPNGKCFPNEVP
jgi:hypothetical protein